MEKLMMPWGTMAFTDTGGEGLPLIFVPGTFCDTTDWDRIVPELPDSIRSVCMDLRVHGESSGSKAGFTFEDICTDILALSNHLGLDEFVLVGHSLGGKAAILTAAESSQVVGLVLLEAWTSFRSHPAFNDEHNYAGLDQRALRFVRDRDALVRARIPDNTWRELVQSVQEYDAWEDLNSLTIPILDLWGTAGEKEDTLELLRIPQRPNIEIIWVPDAGHYLPLAAPGAVVSACVQIADLVSRTL